MSLRTPTRFDVSTDGQSSSTDTLPMPATNTQKETMSEQKETIQELLARLEKNLLLKTKAIEELKEKIYAAQEDKYKALLELSSVKEQYLLNVVTALQKEK